MAALKIFQDVAQLLRGRFRIEPKNPVDDMVRPSLIGRVEIARFSRRFEWPDHDSGRIRPQIQYLPLQELGLRQRGPLGLFEVRSRECHCATNFDRGFVRTFAAARFNCRISTRPRRYDRTDSAPLFSLGRSGWSPSEQLPVSGSINVVCRSFSPRNQSNARVAAASHSAPMIRPPCGVACRNRC